MNVLIDLLLSIVTVTGVGLLSVGLAVLLLYVPMRMAGLYG